MNDSVSWYEVRNVTPANAEISITDEIGLFGISAASFINQLKSLGNRRINVSINSPGGEIFQGNAIYNALRLHSGGVDTSISALAASMASVIAMAGEKRSIAENGVFMIHNPWTVTFGESKDLQRDARLLDDLKQSIVTTYAGATGIPREKLSKMMDDETWLSAKEALDFGFVTEISPSIKASASYHRFDIRSFSKRPENLMSTLPETPETPETPQDSVPPETPAAIETPSNDVSAFEAKIDALFDKMAAKHKEEIQNLHDSYKAKISAIETKYDRLASARGVLEAQNVIHSPAFADQHQSLIDIYNGITDPTEKAIFYQENREKLKNFVNVPPAA